MEYSSARIADVEIVAECANGFEAVKAVSELQPDLLILDVQMPKLNGFEVLELVGRDVAVVFVTAYDQYAIRAFEVHAVDYLLKPFCELTGFAEAAVARARAAAGARARWPADGAGGRARPRSADRAGGHPRRPARARAAGREDRLRAGAGRLRGVADGRAALPERADARRSRGAARRARDFVRIHRSYLLNIERLARVELYAKDSRVAILTDGTKLPVSRAGHARLQKLQ